MAIPVEEIEAIIEEAEQGHFSIDDLRDLAAKYRSEDKFVNMSEEKTSFREWIERFLEKVPDDALINCCIEMSYSQGAKGDKEIMVTGLHPNDADWQKRYPSSKDCWGGTPLNRAKD